MRPECWRRVKEGRREGGREFREKRGEEGKRNREDRMKGEWRGAEWLQRMESEEWAADRYNNAALALPTAHM